ncbi:MAG: aminopeptidase P family protein [Gammaproteobacteria bacterium]|nr:aminopeptidase P family protein [Gammaproteobacteria bacterium]
MTIGVGGSSAETTLSKITSQRDQTAPIAVEEYYSRLGKLRELMAEANIDAFYLDASTSLRYFTGLICYPSERLHGAIITANELFYVCPAFEEEKTKAGLLIDGELILWQEHEVPTLAVVETVLKSTGENPSLAVDDQTPFFTADGLQKASARIRILNGGSLITACRRIKSTHELSLLRKVKAITLKVQKAAAEILYEGIDTRDVQTFLDDAHIACGMDGRSTFKIVLFGKPTAYPHGVPYPQTLKEGDMVLIDTGATLHGYHSDITRSYVFGEPAQRQRELWELEQAAQLAAFQAAQIGASCSAPDSAARKVITAAGLGPDYQIPGLPHRTGHGVGMDVHEHPYIVKGNELPLAAGMCFSIEPMICSYGEFGVRLEDHVWMAEDGPHWFTEPSGSMDDPFNLEKTGKGFMR